MNPPLPLEISAFEPPSPSEFPVTFRRGGVWIFSGTTQSQVVVPTSHHNSVKKSDFYPGICISIFKYHFLIISKPKENPCKMPCSRREKFERCLVSYTRITTYLHFYLFQGNSFIQSGRVFCSCFKLTFKILLSEFSNEFEKEEIRHLIRVLRTETWHSALYHEA